MKIRALSALLLSTTAAYADVPNVSTDIPAVHSLVSKVMGDLGTPSLLMQQGASPHGYAMRPSEAAALQASDLVVWMSEDLSPWLENAIENVAPDAVSLELLHAPGTEVLPFRETTVFGGDEEHHDDHHDDHDEHDEDKHDDHDDHGHDEEHAHDDHDDHGEDKHDDHDDHGHDEHGEDEHGEHEDHAEEEHDDHGHDDHGHDHDGDDPHAWLDAHNAITWVGAIADALSQLDPENATTYAANADAAAKEFDALAHDLEHQLEGYKGKHFVVFHDAYQYFENMTGLKADGSLLLSDARPPSAAQLADIQAEIKEHNITCVFSEPQFSDALVTSVTNGELSTSQLDPLGVDYELGPNLYTELLQGLANSFESCLK